MTSTSIVFFLADVTVKATALLIIAAIIALLSRRASASFRHLVWALGLGCALCLPLLSHSLPPWRITVRLPAKQVTQPALSSPPALPLLTEMHSNGDESSPASVHPSLTQPVPPSVSPHIPWSSWVILIWAAGFCLMLTRIIRGFSSLRVLAATSRPIEDDPIAELKAVAIRSMGVKRPVILFTDTANRVTVPITWGTLHPVILLPAEAIDWPEDRLRAALLHELTHVRRWDWLLQTLARLACALHWFNPFVWLATRQMRAESETACDDLVLTAGVPAADYARHLLDVALRARNGRRIGTEAVAMAQGPHVEGRLRLVLAAGLSRGAVRSRVAMCTLAAALLLALPLAAMHIERVQDIFSSADAIQSLPGGGIIHLVGLSYSPSANQVWWGKDGHRLARPPQGAAGQDYIYSKIYPHAQAREFLIETDGLHADSSLEMTIPSALGSSIGGLSLPQAAHQSGNLIIALLPASARSCTMRVCVAFQPWQTALFEDRSQMLLGKSFIGHLASGNSFTVNFSPPRELLGKLVFDVSYTVGNDTQTTRIVAIDVQGRTVVADTNSTLDKGTTRTKTFIFPTLTLKDIKQLQFQVRPSHWLEFRNIPLQPIPPVTLVSSEPSVFPKDQSDTAAAHIARGQQLEQTGQPGDQIVEFRRAVQIDPSNAEAQAQLAYALFNINVKRVGNKDYFPPVPPAALDEAILHMRRAVALWPASASLHSGLSQFLLNRGDHVAAVAELRRAMHLLPPLLASDRHSGPDGALSSNARQWDQSYWMLGQELVLTGRYKEAVTDLGKALRLSPSDEGTLVWLGDALKGSGRSLNAQAAWTKSLAVQPQNPTFHRMALQRLAQQ